MLFEVLATSLVSGAINALGQSSARKDQNDKLNQAILSYENMKYSNQDKTINLDHYSDVWNTNIMETLNESSVGIALSGAVNPETVKTGMASKMLGQKEETLLKSLQDMDQYNKQIDSRITELQLNKATGSEGLDFLTGAVSGAGVGLQISNYMETQKLNEKYFGALDKLFPENADVLSNALSDTTSKLQAVDTIFDSLRRNNGDPGKDMFHNKTDFPWSN